MIAQELEVSLHMAFVEARQKQHESITVEHLLLAMLDNPSAAEVLKACGVDLDELRGVESVAGHAWNLGLGKHRRPAGEGGASGLGWKAPTVGERGQSAYGRRTESMTWMTPFEAEMFTAEIPASRRSLLERRSPLSIR